MAEPTLEWRGDVLYRDGVKFATIEAPSKHGVPFSPYAECWCVTNHRDLFNLFRKTREEAVALAESWAKTP